MDEQNKYSGLVVCADCGSVMVLHRAHTMAASYNHFTCRTYKKDGTVCTAHYIRECMLDDVVLEDLRRVTAMAREHTSGVCGIHRRQTVRGDPKRDPWAGTGTGRFEEAEQGTGQHLQAAV
ncbi:MAG: zinc ribbon domain-containing protein [Oscillospiraceae bacterium]